MYYQNCKRKVYYFQVEEEIESLQLLKKFYSFSRDNAEYFCDFIKKGDIDIEKITQLTSESDNLISQELLIEWIILTKIINQLISNEGISNQKEIQDLKIFF